MAPHVGGIIGNPLYGPGLFLGGFSTGTSTAWWSVSSEGLRVGTYFLFEAAFAAVTLALVGVVVLRKMKLGAFLAFASSTSWSSGISPPPGSGIRAGGWRSCGWST
jgi:Amt family ammonium transporter